MLAGLRLPDVPGSEASGGRLEFKDPGAEGGGDSGMDILGGSGAFVGCGRKRRK